MGSVTVPRCDTGSQDEVGSVLDRLTRKRQPQHIAGVINSGGVLADGMIASQTPGETHITPRRPSNSLPAHSLHGPFKGLSLAGCVVGNAVDTRTMCCHFFLCQARCLLPPLHNIVRHEEDASFSSTSDEGPKVLKKGQSVDFSPSNKVIIRSSAPLTIFNNVIGQETNSSLFKCRKRVRLLCAKTGCCQEATGCCVLAPSERHSALLFCGSPVWSSGTDQLLGG